MTRVGVLVSHVGIVRSFARSSFKYATRETRRCSDGVIWGSLPRVEYNGIWLVARFRTAAAGRVSRYMKFSQHHHPHWQNNCFSVATFETHDDDDFCTFLRLFFFFRNNHKKSIREDTRKGSGHRVRPRGDDNKDARKKFHRERILFVSWNQIAGTCQRICFCNVVV